MLCVSGRIILEMKGHVKTFNDGKENILKVLNSGEALAKFCLMLISSHSHLFIFHGSYRCGISQTGKQIIMQITYKFAEKKSMSI